MPQSLPGSGVQHAVDRLRPGDILSDRQIVASETRICAKIDTVVVSFNEVLKQGLGEVSTKYPVVLQDFVKEWDIRPHGRRFPRQKLSTNYNLDDFKMTIFEFRGLDLRTARMALRDIRRFLGCFVFKDVAGEDLANLLVSIFKLGLLRSLIVSQLWRAKKSYLRSLKVSLKHFVAYLLHEQRMLRAFGGLTTALTNLDAAIFVKFLCVWS